MERERTSGLSERMHAAMADQQKTTEQAVRMWAVEQVVKMNEGLGEKDAVQAADVLATYVLTGEK